MTDTDRLQVAEQRVSALELEVKALKTLLGKQQRTVAAPPRRDEPQVRVTSPPLAKIELPTETEYQRLLGIVLTRYPQLRPHDTRGFEQEFRWAFRFLQHTGRDGKIDRNHDLLFWIDTAAAWLREHKIAHGVGGIGALAFASAAIASGDILFTSLDEFPYVYFGLVPYGGGIPAKDFWRRSLAGALVEPLPPLHSTARPAPARIMRQQG